jgi:hypothetical protein
VGNQKGVEQMRDLTNQKVGVALCVAKTGKGKEALYHFTCECGTDFHRKVISYKPHWDEFLSCGCKTDERFRKNKHGTLSTCLKKQTAKPAKKPKGMTCINCRHEVGYMCSLKHTTTGEHGECLQWQLTEATGTLQWRLEHDYHGSPTASNGYVRLAPKGR